jgi:hypothetical protein
MTEQKHNGARAPDSETPSDSATSEHGGTFKKAKQAVHSAKAKFDEAGGLDGLKEKGREGVRKSKDLADKGIGMAKQKFDEAGGLDGLKERGREGVRKSKQLADKGIGMAKQNFEDAGGVDGLKGRCEIFAAEVRAGFVPAEGAKGYRRVVSRVTNLWRSGRSGKICIITLSLVAMIVVSNI